MSGLKTITFGDLYQLHHSTPKEKLYIKIHQTSNM